jgi:hypothetical protein
MNKGEWDLRSYRTDMEPRPLGGELGRIFAYAHRTTLCWVPPEIGDENLF